MPLSYVNHIILDDKIVVIQNNRSVISTHTYYDPLHTSPKDLLHWAVILLIVASQQW